jgi:hypothetical protein
MGIIRKYAFVLVLVAAVIYVYAPLGHEDIAKLRWLDDINVIISKSLAPAKREVHVVSVDPVAAADVDEDLDYRIAQRMKSIEGWRSFLEAHPGRSGRAQSARAELDKLVAAQTPPTPEAVRTSPEMKTPSEAASPSQPSPGPEVATPTIDEVCGGDEDRLERLSNSRSSDEAMRFLTELRCEKLRPQLFRLTERLDSQDPTPAAVATQGPSSTVAGPSSRVVRAKVTSRVASAPAARWRATEPQNRARRSVASRSVQPRRPANGWTGPSLPPIFLALFGEEPRNSTTFQRPRARGGGFGTSSGGVGGAASTSGAAGGVASAAGASGGGSGGGSGSGGGGSGGGGGGSGGGGSGGGGGGH